MTTREQVLRIIRANPGFTGFQIMEELRKNSKTGRRFGVDSIWTILFGPSLGAMYAAIWDLEEEGILTTEWAEIEPGKTRPLFYFASE
jgi:DNA-binding PadR family transcriptional regulator